ncbi:MAG: 50S ribosomal protein L9 [Chloroflexi bacterium CFX4]|nr:50S ribosomal protein L9 [Chloroflexi bacterium CFX4]MDL1921549.1 50S ribosomal protein L9 [Chloroflexi bacterium CFX3]
MQRVRTSSGQRARVWKAPMKVILTEYIYKHGVAGDVVDVADGFARNWLIPRKMAIPATKANLAKMESLRTQAAANRSEINERIREASAKIDGTEIVFGMKAGSNNKLYGSITSQMIKDAILKQTGVDINRRRISERPIRELGRYEVPIRMGEISPVVQVIVVREEEVQAFLAAREAERAAAAQAAEFATIEEVEQ